jgi:hypothetical protein
VAGAEVETWLAEGPTSTAPYELKPQVNVKHSGSGTVRWRWLETDEMNWMPCGELCCPYKDPG